MQVHERRADYLLVCQPALAEAGQRPPALDAHARTIQHLARAREHPLEIGDLRPPDLLVAQRRETARLLATDGESHEGAARPPLAVAAARKVGVVAEELEAGSKHRHRQQPIPGHRSRLIGHPGHVQALGVGLHALQRRALVRGQSRDHLQHRRRRRRQDAVPRLQGLDLAVAAVADRHALGLHRDLGHGHPQHQALGIEPLGHRLGDRLGAAAYCLEGVVHVPAKQVDGVGQPDPARDLVDAQAGTVLGHVVQDLAGERGGRTHQVGQRLAIEAAPVEARHAVGQPAQAPDGQSEVELLARR